MNLSIGIGLTTLLLAATARAQLSQSANFRLDDFAFAGGGGAAASPAFIAVAALEPLSGSEVASPSYRAVLGFLGAWDPAFPATGPIVFGVAPAVGPTAGGTEVTVTGIHLNVPGAALLFDASAATNVAAPSSTQLTAVTPPASAGAKSVIVATSQGLDALASAFLYTAGLAPYGTGTPGCSGPHALSASSAPKVGNSKFQITCTHAPANALGLGLIGALQDVTGSDPLSLGFLMHLSLFDPTLSGLDMNSDGAGLGSALIPIPSNPALLGVSLQTQSIWFWSFACPLGAFSLSSSPGLTITIE